MRKEKLDCIQLLLALKTVYLPDRETPEGRARVPVIFALNPWHSAVHNYVFAGWKRAVVVLLGSWLAHKDNFISTKIAITIFSFQLVDSATYRQMHWSNSPSKLQLCVPFSRICWSVSFILYVGLLGGLAVKNLPANAGDEGSILRSGRFLETEMATHSSISVWEIPWTEEPGGLQSMWSQSQTRLNS